MIKNIINWTLGGFFRTLGKFLLFLLLGLALGYFVSKNNIKMPLIGIGKVSAATSIPINSYSVGIGYQNGRCLSGTLPNCDFQISSTEPYVGTAWTTSYSVPSNYYGPFLGYNFRVFLNQRLSSGVTYTLSWKNNITNRDNVDFYNGLAKNMIFYGSTNGSWSGASEDAIINHNCRASNPVNTTTDVTWTCTFTPSTNINYLYLRIFYINSATGDIDYRKYPSGRVSFTNFSVSNVSVIYDNAQVDSINQQTSVIKDQTDIIIRQQEELTETLTDDNVDDSTSLFEDYLDNFNMSIEGPLTAIVRIPIDLLDIILVDYNSVNSHPDLCATLKGQQFCLPSGDIVWKRTGCHDNSPFGCPDRNAFKNFFQLLGGGAICYMLLRRVVKVSEKVIDPTKSEMDVMKL